MVNLQKHRVTLRKQGTMLARQKAYLMRCIYRVDCGAIERIQGFRSAKDRAHEDRGVVRSVWVPGRGSCTLIVVLGSEEVPYKTSEI